jgi:hypothetical protein
MSDELDFSKVDLVFTKQGITPDIKARCGLAIDISGSMTPLFVGARSVVQNVVERILALAVKLDDDGTMNMWAFNSRSHELPDVTSKGFGTYVSRHVKPLVTGGTLYSPVLNAVLKSWFPSVGFFAGLLGKKASPTSTSPALLVFVTDGDNDAHDEDLAEEIMKMASKYPLYIAFVGIGGASFSFIKRVAEAYPNVGFFAVPDLATMSEEDLYNRLVTAELSTWLKNANKNR